MAAMMTGTRTKTAARHLVEQLAAWGCRTVYGVAGDENLYLLDALAGQDAIQYVACRLETTAALMASAEAKLTGRLTACTAGAGPGAALLTAGLGDAALDRAPVLAITGQVERKKIGTGAKQAVDQQFLLQPFARYTATTADPGALPMQLNRAMRTALEEGGVAHLSVPKDVWTQQVDSPIFPPPPKRKPPRPAGEEMERAVRAMEGAKRPIILAGRGTEESREALLALAERLTAPITVTMPARPVVPADHPLFLGGLGQAGSGISSELLRESDLCLVLGATWWPEDFVPKEIPVVQADISPGQIGLHAPVVAGIVGEMDEVLKEWLERLRPQDRSEWKRRIEGARIRWKEQIEREARQRAVPLAPQQVIAALAKVVDDDAVIALDTGDHTLWFNRIFQPKNQEILLSGRWRTLGFALPAAMAAKRVYDGRQVVALAGDGGFATTMADLITAVRYGWPIAVIVMNNGSFAMEKNRMEAAGLDASPAGLVNPDFAALAEAFGGEGHFVEEADQLEEVLRRALSSRRLSIVEVRIGSPRVPHTRL
ncbi:pyruvate oxidase [Planifilum fulgidum]|jgi:pyruvate oxidase|uniref:Pyruvate oxidase n=1 Tax=Planifilum fulgidum TaxID=201973 RepID=A0A1I2KZ80_9BACL|nr:thiamine pyrophosphate-binding protein [Planifilum fulgidum]MBO2495504.1 thiamine pyrophosphate-binding protein [Bacillota bacterium]MBO2531636.1 pyruvate oxidase [Thermoactinomycetaceae bacterium]SFF71570.1 pyruvate oxidase [Planifilum fulgidum]